MLSDERARVKRKPGELGSDELPERFCVGSDGRLGFVTMRLLAEQSLRKTMPAFPGYLRFIGPGLVWMALAQGSSELIWWPYIVAKYGLAFLFLLVPACFLQFPVVFEIGRYTLLTGEGIFRGFLRLNRVFGILLWLLCTASFLWFGAFASAGGTALAALTDFPRGGFWTPERQSLFWGQLSILVFAAALLYVRRVYALIEWVMRIVAVVSLVGMLFACLHPTARSAAGTFFIGILMPDREAMRSWDPKDATTLLTAVAWVGLGGFWTLFYSYWMREKGVGMAAVSEGTLAIPQDEPRLGGSIRQWCTYLSIETLIGIVGNLVTTMLACLLAFAILRPQGKFPGEWQIAVVQADFFAQWWGEPGRKLFLFIAGAFLADTWLGTVDGVARLHLDVLGTLWPGIERNRGAWYRGIVIVLTVVTSVTMFFRQPGQLMLMTAVLGFVGTVIYCGGLFALNHLYLPRRLPAAAWPGRWSRAAIVGATIVYLVFAGIYLWLQRPAPVVSSRPEAMAIVGQAMASEYRITVVDPPKGLTVDTLRSVAGGELHRIDAMLSTYQVDSPLSQFNRSVSTDWQAVPAELALAVKLAMDVAQKSDGAYDITVGPLVNLWGFGPTTRRAAPPTPGEILAARSNVGLDLVEVDLDPPALRKKRPGVYVDLSSVGQGIAVDKAAEALERLGVLRYCVDFSGEVRTRGLNAEGQPWRIGVETPTPGVRSLYRVIALSGESIATSGDYRNFIDGQGRRLSHILDPRTGYPVDHALVSVSVIAPTCAVADAWSTALLACGPDEAYQLALRHNLRVLLLVQTPQSLVERSTPGFPSPEHRELSR